MSSVARAAEALGGGTAGVVGSGRRGDVGRDGRPVTLADDPHLAHGVETLAQRAVDAVVETAVQARDQVGWLSWRRYDAVSPAVLRAGDVSVYGGDAGILWAGTQLAPELERDDLGALLPGIARRVRASGGSTGGGLLDGSAGTVLALGRASRTDAGPPAVSERAPRLPRAVDVAPHTDHLSGLSGLLLARISAGALRGAAGEETLEVVDALLAAGRPELVGRAFPGPDGGRGLCGLAHGASGVVLALAHWLAVAPSGARAEPARRVLADTLLWEAAWADPVRGWPDLREVETAYPGQHEGQPAPGAGPGQESLIHPTLWCHGAAGVAAVRLELCRLLDLGADLGRDVIPAAVRAEAEVGVALCGRYVLEETAAAGARPAVRGTDPTSGTSGSAGLTVCHGLGGPLDVLATAAVLWQVPEHLAVARHAALTVAAQLGEDPACWPTGLRTHGGAGLFLGLAGTAMVLTRLARSRATVATSTSAVDSPSLFGVPG